MGILNTTLSSQILLSTMTSTTTMRLVLLCGAVSLAHAMQSQPLGTLAVVNNRTMPPPGALPPVIPPTREDSLTSLDLLNAGALPQRRTTSTEAAANPQHDDQYWRTRKHASAPTRRLTALAKSCQVGVGCLVLLGDLILVAIAAVCCFAAIRRLLAPKQDSLIPRYA